MTSAPRTLTVAALLVLATSLAGCGDDADDRADSAPSASAPVWATPAESTPPAVAPSATPGAGTTPSAPPRAGRTTPPVPGGPGRTRTPQFVMPTRSAGAPSARQVVDAFRAAKLPVSGVRDRSVDCGPNGAGLGCAELLVTDAVSVYVFPDEANAVNRADMWGADAYRKGTVVLSYLGTTTSTEQRRRYEAVLADLG
ncbi:hypothetical protein [Micromonospora sagamiensis]|uniref:Uncharacterized protein n=1 Tax=Micromonospora sagamiensis TaxID=47875 RepID=A0A562WMG7_9ACTN|nr:hypothetical protein [Micromonospora sagamiensis]TWJ30634.1 hypothetical protein JD81_04179 [Micromonospora sagamiensis]BCL16334.1 hypothetical protein GCM10017556_40730 [Micromonospora sagamiensis]